MSLTLRNWVSRWFLKAGLNPWTEPKPGHGVHRRPLPTPQRTMINPEILDNIEKRFADITTEMSDPSVATDPKKMALLGREHTSLRTIVEEVRLYRKNVDEISDLKELLTIEDDEEMIQMAKAELSELESTLPEKEEDLRLMLIPKNPEDAKDAIIEVRAGTGGDEAALFCRRSF